MGLAVSKRFIEMHGGRIWVESDGVPGHGSQFHFTLPLPGTESVTLSALQGTRKLVSAPAGRGRTLLLLDQDPTIVRIMEQGLEDYQIVPVDDVSQVRGLVDKLHARAVVLNSATRGLAWRQMRELQQRLGDSPVPVALCPLVGERQLAEALGVNAYLVDSVYYGGKVVIVERSGKPMVAVIPVEMYQRLIAEREARFQVLDRVRSRLPDASSEEAERDVAKAIAVVRRDRAERGA